MDGNVSHVDTEIFPKRIPKPPATEPRSVKKQIPISSLTGYHQKSLHVSSEGYTMAIVKARSSLFPLVAGAAILLNCDPIRAEDWPQWRGPHFNGSSTEKGLPSAWSKDDALWRTELPGPSAATPVI